jgi:predicted acetyltransferase
MPDPEITLVRADPERKDELYQYALEFHEAGDERYKSLIDDPEPYWERLEKLAEGKNLAPGKVRMWLFWLQRDGRIVAESSLRHELTDDLRLEGGNIGYNVRPSERRKGYGSMILTLVLEEARKIGLEKVLVTCDTHNIGSRRIIEKNGGVLEGQGMSKISGRLVNRYWIGIDS